MMRRVFTAFESGAARLICYCVYWCPLTPLNGGADARVLLSIVDLYLKMKVSYMLELLSFVISFRTERYLLESTVFPLNLIERCILLLAFTVLQIGVVLFGNICLSSNIPFFLVEVVIRLHASGRGSLRAKRRSQRCDAREPGKGEFLARQLCWHFVVVWFWRHLQGDKKLWFFSISISMYYYLQGGSSRGGRGRGGGSQGGVGCRRSWWWLYGL